MRKGAESLVWWEEVLDAWLNMVLELRTDCGNRIGYDGSARDSARVSIGNRSVPAKVCFVKNR